MLHLAQADFSGVVVFGVGEGEAESVEEVSCLGDDVGNVVQAANEGFKFGGAKGVGSECVIDGVAPGGGLFRWEVCEHGAGVDEPT